MESDWERIRRSAAGAGRAGASPWERHAPGAAEGPDREDPRYAAPDGAPPAGGPAGLAGLLMLLEAVRGMVPRELEQQLTALVRELLLTLRAVIDWYLERIEGGASERHVEDIPID